MATHLDSNGALLDIHECRILTIMEKIRERIQKDQEHQAVLEGAQV